MRGGALCFTETALSMDLRPRSRSGLASWVCELCDCLRTHTKKGPRLRSVPCHCLHSANTFFEQGAPHFHFALSTSKFIAGPSPGWRLIEALCSALFSPFPCHQDPSGQTVWVLVAQSRPTLCNPRDCSPPDSSVHGILQARILQWVAAIPFSRDLPDPVSPGSLTLHADSLLTELPGKQPMTPDSPQDHAQGWTVQCQVHWSRKLSIHPAVNQLSVILLWILQIIWHFRVALLGLDFWYMPDNFNSHSSQTPLGREMCYQGTIL